MNIGVYDLVSLVVPIAILAFVIYLLYRYGTQEVLVEQHGNIKTVRKITITPQLIAIIIVAVIVAIFSMSYKIIPQGYGGVKFNHILKKYSILGEGGNFIITFLETIYQYDLQIREYTISTSVSRKGEGTVWSISSDGVSVGLEATLLYQLNRDNLMLIHKNLGMDYDVKIVQPVFKSALKSIISAHTSEELISFSKNEIDEELKKIVKSKLEPLGIRVVDALIRDVKFSPDYEKALEEKQIAQQEALKMKYLIKKESLSVQRMLVEAKGKAEAISIVAKELKKNPEYIGYLYVDKLSDKIKVIIANEKTLLNLDEVLKER
ncbi:MAG: prohibitin family protein [candidate division WOR-3 bacterium]